MKVKYICPSCGWDTTPKKRPNTLPLCSACHCLMEPPISIKWSIVGSLACPYCGCQVVPFGTKCPSCDEVHN